MNRVILTAGALNVVLAAILAPRFFHIGMAWSVVCAEAFVCLSLVRIALGPAAFLSQSSRRLQQVPEKVSDEVELTL